MKRFNALTIAGTDPSGGAGVQADLKTFSALGVYGCSVITALVAQNTLGVQSIYHIKADFITTQIQSVLNDVRIDTIKIGMLPEEDIVTAVTEQLKYYNMLHKTVLDTVMIAKHGDTLSSKSALIALKKQLLPHVAMITPNLPEASVLLETSCANNEKDIIKQGLALLSFGCNTVLIKGGHLNNKDSSPDWLFTKNGVQCFTAPRIKTKNTHGAGCTLSSAIAALHTRYPSWIDTVREAKSWLSTALSQADILEVGAGIGPVHHFHAWW